MTIPGLRVATGQHNRTPDEVTAFTMNFTDALGDGETLTTVDAQEVIVDGATGTDLVIDSIQILSSSLSITVSLGEDDGIYFVKVRMNTNLGQKIEGAVRVVVQNAVGS